MHAHTGYLNVTSPYETCDDLPQSQVGNSAK